MKQQIERGHAPPHVKFVNKGVPQHCEQPHVHFDNKAALNMDGTWKHGFFRMNREMIEWLREFGWSI